MSYQVLARKYRPNTFAEVVGQDTIIHTLQEALRSGRIAHAFLLTGSRGVGKTTVARLLAKALVCEKGVTPEPCGQCSMCLSIGNGSSLDVLEIDGASNTGVDDIRELREAVRFQPASARFKIFIIDEVHMLSTNAFNALLKTLEEPPPHVKFIFATTEAHKIPATILSRCQRYDFKRLSTATIVDKLQTILDIEKIRYDSSSLNLIARTAQGGMRDALSLTDQVISFAGAVGSPDEVSDLLGVVDQKTITALVKAILERQHDGAFSILSGAYQKGLSLGELMGGVAELFRHVALCSFIKIEDALIDLSPDDLAEIAGWAKQYDQEDLKRLFSIAVDGLSGVVKSETPKLAAELLILKMTTRPSGKDIQAITDAISRLEKLGQARPTSAAIPASQPPARPIPEPKFEPRFEAKPEPKPEQENTLSGIDPRWQAFVNQVTDRSAALGHHLEHGQLIEASPSATSKGLVLRVQFLQRLHHQAIHDARFDAPFRADLAAHFGPHAQLEPLFGKEAVQVQTQVPAATISQARETVVVEEQQALEEKAKADPMIQKALELFGGEIRGVKKVV